MLLLAYLPSHKFIIENGTHFYTVVSLYNYFFYDINLNPSDYNSNSKNLLEPRDKWFLNTNNSVRKEVVGLLQMREDFCLPPTDNADSIIQCIKHIENNLSRLQNNNSKNRFRK